MCILLRVMQQDFARIGLNTVQKRRLMRTLRGNPSTSSNVPTPPEAEPPAVAPKTLPAPASTTAVVPGTVEEAEPPSSAKQDSPSMNVYISPFLKGPEVIRKQYLVKLLVVSFRLARLVWCRLNRKFFVSRSSSPRPYVKRSSSG
jgi:hypothetical protein